MKKKKIIIITGSIVAVLLIIGVQFFADWYKFYSVEKGVRDVTSELEHQYTINNIKVEKYCSYGHHKFDTHGDLGCSIHSVFTSSNSDLSKPIVEKLAKIGWLNGVDNISNMNTDSEEGIPTFSRAYYLRGKTCSFYETEVKSGSNYYFDCYGTALHEWYPVRD